MSIWMDQWANVHENLPILKSALICFFRISLSKCCWNWLSVSNEDLELNNIFSWTEVSWRKRTGRCWFCWWSNLVCNHRNPILNCPLALCSGRQEREDNARNYWSHISGIAWRHGFTGSESNPKGEAQTHYWPRLTLWLWIEDWQGHHQLSGKVDENKSF